PPPWSAAAAWTAATASRACPSTCRCHRLISAFFCALPDLATGGSGDASVGGVDISAVAAELISPVNNFLLPPLRALIGYCEISADLWLRNGLQMKGQAMTYVHSSFCCSLVDLDLHLVQLAIALLPDRAQTVRCLFRLLHLDELVSLRAAAGDNAFIG
uniref:E3 ubiquitin-protein ligase n=1 Tax=Macrostomum lignano TaxID=282301 RepID=A0A1I8HAM0_9PLAT